MKTIIVKPALAVTWNPSNIIFNKLSDKYEYTEIPTTNGYQLVFTDTEFGNISIGDTVVEYRDDGICELAIIKSEYTIDSDIQKKVIIEQNQINKADILRIIEELNIGIVNDIIIEMNDVSTCHSSTEYDKIDIDVNSEIVDSIDCGLTDIIHETMEKYNKPKLKDGYVTIVKKDTWNRDELVKIIADYERVIYGVGGYIDNKINRYLKLKNI